MLEARHITKKFSGITALSDVSLVLHPGKVNAIIGENGAGKSTLMKISRGVTDYEGEISTGNSTVSKEEKQPDASSPGTQRWG